MSTDVQQDPTPATEPDTQPDAGASTTPAGQPIEAPQADTYSAPFASFPDAQTFNKRMEREARKRQNQAAQELGFDDWQHMQTDLAAQRQAATPDPETPPTPDAPQQPVSPPSQPDEAKRLRMALSVAQELNLPAALIGRLQGETVEAMTADAQSLVALMQQSQGRTPGIPSAPQGGQPVTFSRAQMSDPAFVRQHADEIQRAAREGRIVN